YQIKMAVAEDMPGVTSASDWPGRENAGYRAPLKSFLQANPDAVAALTANYPVEHTNSNLQNENDAAGLIISAGHTYNRLDPDLHAKWGGNIGQAILGLTKEGKPTLIKTPSDVEAANLEISHLTEAIQLGPILIWPDASGIGQIPDD